MSLMILKFFHFFNKGRAIITSPLNISFNMTIDTFWPVSSGAGGGALLYVNGSGFNSFAVVTLGDDECKITSLSYNQIICMIPAQV